MIRPMTGTQETDTPQGDGKPPTTVRFSWKRAIPLLLLIAGFAAFFAFGGNRYLSFEALARHHDMLKAWVGDHGPGAALLYFLAYAAVIAFSVPGGAVMTIGGGFLFGWLMGGALAVAGATLGATVIFLAAKTALGDALRARAGGWVRRLEDGFRDNAFSYLLTLRLIPVVPFWLLNIVPAFLGVRWQTYVAATALGIVPGTFVYASVGHGLGAVIARGERPDLGIIFEPAVLLPLLGLALLSLLPVAYRKLRRTGAAVPPEGPPE